jgi:hypothetical protein
MLKRSKWTEPTDSILNSQKMPSGLEIPFWQYSMFRTVPISHIIYRINLWFLEARCYFSPRVLIKYLFWVRNRSRGLISLHLSRIRFVEGLGEVPRVFSHLRPGSWSRTGGFQERSPVRGAGRLRHFTQSCSGRTLSRYPILLSSVSDPYSFDTDPAPAF